MYTSVKGKEKRKTYCQSIATFFSIVLLAALQGCVQNMVAVKLDIGYEQDASYFWAQLIQTRDRTVLCCEGAAGIQERTEEGFCDAWLQSVVGVAIVAADIGDQIRCSAPNSPVVLLLRVLADGAAHKAGQNRRD